jgi:hypothetical protein
VGSFNDINRIAVPRKSFGRSPIAAAASAPARPIQTQRIASELPRAPVVEPAAPAMVSAAEPDGFESHRVVTRSFALMGRNGVTYLALIAAAAMPDRIAYHMGGAILSPLLAWAGCLPLYAAVFSVAMGDLSGQPVSFAGALRAAKATSASAFTAIAVTVLSVWFLAIVSARAADRALVAPVAILEGKGWADARARSTALIAPCRARVRLLLLLLAGFAVSRGLAMMPLWDMPAQALPLFLAGNWLFPLLLTAFTAVAGAALYHEAGAMAAGPAQAMAPSNSLA